MPSDRLIRYYFPKLGVSAAWARLEQVHQRLHELTHAPRPAAQWLSQCACAAALLLSCIKLRGKLSIQVQSKSALKLLFAECTDQGYLRAIARANSDAENFPDDFALASARGSMAITIEPDQGERYQGIVALMPEGLSASFEAYFAHSEQLPTQMRLASSENATSGLLVQRVAAVGGHDDSDIDPDGWNRITQLVQTLSDEELAALDEETLMHRLFHEETVLMLREQTLSHFCPCSRERVGAMLVSIGHDEALAAANAAGFASIVCEFCNVDYRFDLVDIERLFHLAAQAPAGLQ
jgi:molecular chaperone Hsp33